MGTKSRIKKSNKSKKRSSSLISVTPQPPNTITLDDATEYISTLPQDEQKTFYHHLNQILILKDKFPNSAATDSIMEHHVNQGAKGKTKRKQKKAGTRKNISELVRKREETGRLINLKNIHPTINDRINTGLVELKNQRINYLKNQIKQTYKKHGRAQIDGDEDKRNNLAIKLEKLIEEVKEESPNLNNEEELATFFTTIEHELEEEQSDSESELAPPEPVFDDDNDSNEGHHSGRSSRSSASSKKRKKRKKRQ